MAVRPSYDLCNVTPSAPIDSVVSVSGSDVTLIFLKFSPASPKLKVCIIIVFPRLSS